jgi:glycosyltransferase involved in cell wall biosynthesis
MGKTDPEIALVVCTRNRAEKLAPFFDAIKQITCLCVWELVIVDNGSTDKTSEYLLAFAATFAGQITVITEPRIGLSLARNRGWRASTAPIIAFTDDDCYPDKNILNDIKIVFADQSLGYAGGRILLYDPSDALVTVNESLIETYLQAGGFVYTGFIQGANMAFRRQALIDINGFDDSLGAGTKFACEDVDAVLRISAAGWKGKHDPRLIVYHHHRRKPGKDVESLWQSYDTGRGAYYMKCILFMPQRWKCLRYWLNSIKVQPFALTLREVKSAIYYGFQLFKQKPNIKH